MIKRLLVLVLCLFWVESVHANYLEYNTGTQTVLVGPFLLYSDGVTPVADVDISAGVTACAWEGVACTSIAANTWSHVSAGFYSLTLNATDVNTYGRLVISFDDPDNFLPVWHEFTVVTTNVYDSFGGDGADKLQVDVVQLGGDTQSGTDLKDFSDAGYNPATDKVTGVLLVDTCTANSDLVTAANVVDEFETQSQADPTGFHVNVKEVNETAQTANDNGADINAILVDSNELQTDWTNAGRLDAILDIIAADTTTDIPDLIATAQADLNTITGSDGVTLATAQALYAPATAAALTTHDGKLDTVDGIVDDILVDTAAQDTSTELRTLLVGSDTPLSTLTTAQVNTEADTALSDIGLDHLIGAAVIGADVTDNSIVARIASKSATADWDSFVNTTDSLEALRDNQGSGGTTPADVWAYGTRILTANTNLNDVSAAEVNAECDTALTEYDPPTRAELTTDKDSIITEVNANETKIDTMQGNVTDILTDTGTTLENTLISVEWDVTDILADTGTTLDGKIDTIAADVVNIDGDAMRGTDGANTTVPDAAGTAAALHTTTDGKIDVIDGIVDDILVDTAAQDTSTELRTLLTGADTAVATLTTAQVNTECDTALTEYDPPTNTEMIARTMPTADYFLFGSDTVANVSTVATLTGHTAQTGNSYAIVNSGTYGNAYLVRSTTPANTLDVNATGEAGIDLDNTSGTLPAVTLANGAHGGAAASITLADYSDFTGAAAANPNVLQSGTITVTDQTHFVISAGSADDDAYLNMVVVFEDSSTATQKSVRTITSYTGATKTVIIDTAPDFTIATSDNFDILAVAPGSTPPTVGQIRAEIDSNSTQLADIVEDTGTTLDGKINTIDTNIDSILSGEAIVN